MKEERIMVLQMINEGKITAEEGVKLLKALSKSGDFEEKLNKAATYIKAKAKEAEPKVKKAAEDIKTKGSELADEIGDRIKAKMNKVKEDCDLTGNIIETDNMDYTFDFEDEFEEEAEAATEEAAEAEEKE